MFLIGKGFLDAKKVKDNNPIEKQAKGKTDSSQKNTWSLYMYKDTQRDS